ncbi:MAG: hypothetical protein M3Z25_04130 [Actinomycetota bacterium]|nr:hypothetical protein [Actinomycetota bacterium]
MESVPGEGRLGEAVVGSRYAGAMLLHGFFDRVGMGAVLGVVAGAGPVSGRARRFDDLALLTRLPARSRWGCPRWRPPNAGTPRKAWPTR